MADYEKNELGIPEDEIVGGDDDDIVTLLSATGEEIDFVEIAGIAHEGKFYVILQPVELLEGMSEDEALVFEVTANGDDAQYSIVLDDEIIDAVFAEYERLLDSVQNDDGDGEE